MRLPAVLFNLSALLAVLALVVLEGCGSSLAQPFDKMKDAPITVFRLQNFEPAQPAQPAAAAPSSIQLPPQIQQWLTAGAAMLPPGLLPPGLLPGQPPVAPPPQNVPRFHEFRILGWMALNDSKQHDEVLDIFGTEKNFAAQHDNCMYAEFGFSFGQGPTSPPADVLVSLSCNQVQAFGFAWPFKTTAMSADTAKRIVAVVQKAFGGG